MKLILRPQEMLTLTLMDEHGQESDGEIEMHYNTKEHPNGLTILDATGDPARILFEAHEDDEDVDMFEQDAMERPADSAH